MIVKHVAMKSVKRSSFVELVKYICDPKDKSERIGHIAVTNCHSEEPGDAALEVLATQARNTRATSDKTYHLIVSFRAGESPSAEALADIERRVCAALGFGEHQRVSAVHQDTDNLHAHVAINKIHPGRLTLHDPFMAYRTLAETCALLEAEHRLEPDNHKAAKRGAETRAADMEAAAGVESLLGWVKRECLAQFQAATCWNELHSAMRANGLTLQVRANGLVIANDSGLTIKASSVSRDLSKAKLDGRFGQFEASNEEPSATRLTRRYKAGPLRSTGNTAELFARYEAERLTATSSRAVELAAARAQKDRLVGVAKRHGRLRRGAIKLAGGSSISRKVLYALANKTLKDAIDTVGKQYLAKRRAIDVRYRRRSWADWLQEQARQGDAQALDVLRARQERPSPRVDSFGGVSDTPPGRPRHLPPDGVTKSGVMVFRVGTCAIRDDGVSLWISRGATDEGVTAALRMAIDRHGETLSVSGSDEFKELVARAAASARLVVRFDTPDLETRRLSLLVGNSAGPTPPRGPAPRSPGIRR